MNEIRNDIGPAIYGTVPDEAEDNTQFRSALWRSTNANPLTTSAFETDGRGRAYPKWLEQQIIDDFTGADFHIYSNKAGQCALHIARRIAARPFQFIRSTRWRTCYESHLASRRT